MNMNMNMKPPLRYDPERHHTPVPPALSPIAALLTTNRRNPNSDVGILDAQPHS